jgi:hypothetical protein
MQVYLYPIHDSIDAIIIIAPIQDEEEYLVFWENSLLGHIIPSIRKNSCSLQWKGSNPILNLLAQQIGEYIENQ